MSARSPATPTADRPMPTSSIPSGVVEPTGGVSILTLSSVGARIVLVLFVLTISTQAVLLGGPPMQNALGWIALAALIGAAVLVVWPAPDPLPIPLTAAVLAAITLAAVCIEWQLPADYSPDYRGWNLGGSNFLLFGVAMRSRIGGSWIGMGLIAVVTTAWSVVVTGAGTMALLVLYQQPVLLAAGTFFAWGLRRITRRTREYQEAELRRIGDEYGRATRAEQRERELTAIRRIAGPALEAIAAGNLSPADRRAHRLLEAMLRDTLRGRRLAREPLRSAVRTARYDGRDVVVLDDLGELEVEEAKITTAARWATSRLRGSVGTATVRLSLVDGRPAVTFATDDQAEPDRLVL